MPSDSTPPSAPTTERITLRASTGVQGKTGMNFGTLEWIAGQRIHLRVDSELVPLEAVSLRVDLSPVAGTALLEATVMRVLPGAPSDPSQYLLRLDRVAPVDHPAWDRYLRTKHSGGTLSDVSDIRGGSSDLRLGYAAVANSKPPPGLGGLRSVPGDTSTASVGSALGGGARRIAMRDALRSAIERTRTAPAAPAPGAAPAQSPAPAAAPLPGTRPPDDELAWVASNVGGRQYLEVRWPSAAAFRYDVHSQLTANALRLTSDGRPLPAIPPLFVVLRFNEVVVQTMATPAQVGERSVVYQLTLDDAQRAMLRGGARATSTISVTPRSSPR